MKRKGYRNIQKGKFIPRHPEKYKGNPKGIIYRSSLELEFCNYLDNNPHVLEWASEEFCIPYFDPAKNKPRRYFPDFWMKAKKGDKIKTMVVEIKPYSQTKPPNIKGRKKKETLIKEAVTYSTNEAKWDAAEQFCKTKGWEFVIVTEKELRGSNK